ncbi:MAG TPA: hypothetical protein VNZ52_11730 [Candidatus Thermoplasmatota archaeon]|nr:hypothetical protein [Candidatus Thermoplasmatota archaeon]
MAQETPGPDKGFVGTITDAAVRAQARERQFRYPEVTAAWALRAALAVMLVQIAYKSQYEATNQGLLALSAAIGLAGSLGFLFIPTTRPRTLKLVEIGMLMSFVLHVAGHLYRWYAIFPHYDTFLHGLGAFVVAGIGLLLSQAVPWMWNSRRVTPFQAFWFCLTFSMTASVLWEIMEFGMDQLFGTKEQDNLFDTMIDFIADTGGALLGGGLAAALTRYADRHGPQAVEETPKPDPVEGFAAAPPPGRGAV